MLSSYKVLDLSTERGLMCGQVLGDLGADVIKVEPPGGSAARQLAPFYRDEPHPNRSLYWWSYNRNKRGITLDLECEEGQALLRQLVGGADFLIESESPGVMERRGLGYETLAALNPRLVYVSITPFGQDGPKAGYVDSDLIIMAAGGPLLLAGDADRPPVRVSVPQAYAHTCVDAAAAALIANHERARSGRGQHVDVSAQQAVTFATQSNIVASQIGEGKEFQRCAGGIRLGPFKVQFQWPAKDGYVSITFLFGSSFGPFTRRLMEAVHEAGFCDEATRDKDWIEYFAMLFTGAEPPEEYDRVMAIVAAFTESQTKAELFALARARGLLIAPIATTEELTVSEQLDARGYWQMQEHPELEDRFQYPGPFAKFSETPLAYRRRPPLVGEHNHEVYVQELGMSETDVADLQARGVL